MCPDLARWRGLNDARVLSNSNSAVLYSRIVLMLLPISDKIEMMFLLVTVSSVGLRCQGYSQRTRSYDPA